MAAFLIIFGAISLFSMLTGLPVGAAGGALYVYGPSGGSFDSQSFRESAPMYIANQDNACFYLYADKMDDMPCAMLYVFNGKDSDAKLVLFPSYMTVLPVYADFPALPDFGAIAGISAAGSKEGGAEFIDFAR